MMVLRSLALALCLSAPAFAQTLAEPLPEPLNDTISDFADVLDETEEALISQLLDEMRAETGVQMVVVTLPGVAAGGGTGQGIEAYGKALFNAWGVGGADRNDGILLLLDSQAREARIALGAGYDPVYDGRAARVLSTAVLPALREGRISDGIEAGVVSARDRLIAPFLAGQPVGVSDGFPDEGNPTRDALAALGVAAGIAGFAFWRRQRKQLRCPNCGAQTLERTREIIERPTRFDSGTGMQHLTCSACGFTDRKSYPISYTSAEARRDRADNGRGGSGGGGSSGGGFGGGRSSGGGATGKW